MRITLFCVFLLIQFFSRAQNSVKITTTPLSETDYKHCFVPQPKLDTTDRPIDTIVLSNENLYEMGRYENTGLRLFISNKDSAFWVIDERSGWAERTVSRPVFSDDRKIFAGIGKVPGRPGIKVFKVLDEKFELVFMHHFREIPLEIRCVTPTGVLVKTTGSDYISIRAINN